MVIVPPFRSSSAIFFVARQRREVLDLGGELEDRAAIRVLHHGHHQALLGVGGEADVVLAAQDVRVVRVVDERVDDGELLQRRDERLDDERQEGELDAALGRVGLGLLAQRRELGHVALVHVREVRRHLLRAHHLLGDLAAHAAQRDDLVLRPARLGAGTDGRAGSAAAAGGRGRGRSVARRRGRRAARGEALDVLAGHAAAVAGGGDDVEVHAQLAGEAARGRRGEGALAARPAATGAAAGAGARAGAGAGAGGGAGAGAAGAAGAAAGAGGRSAAGALSAAGAGPRRRRRRSRP